MRLVPGTVETTKPIDPERSRVWLKWSAVEFPTHTEASRALIRIAAECIVPYGMYVAVSSFAIACASRALCETLMEQLSVNPWQPITDKRELKHLGKLSEECGELVSAISRCIIQGVDEREPVTNKLNREWLEDEIADVLGNIDLVIDHYQLDLQRIRPRSDLKKKRQRIWHKQL